MVLARPPFTPTTPNAWPEGNFLPHCGQEMSLPKTLVEGAGLAANTGILTQIRVSKVIVKTNGNFAMHLIISVQAFAVGLTT